MEEAEVKVMVADESHIKYIDTILTTIAEACKETWFWYRQAFTRVCCHQDARSQGGHRSPGREVRRFQLHRNMGQQALCHHIRFDRSPRLPWFGIGKAHQEPDLYARPTAMASCQDFLFDFRFGCHEDEHPVGLSSSYFRRPDR